MSGEVQYCADLSGKSLNLELLKKLCACATMGGSFQNLMAVRATADLWAVIPLWYLAIVLGLSHLRSPVTFDSRLRRV